MRAQIVLLPLLLAVIILSPPPSATAVDNAARKALSAMVYEKTGGNFWNLTYFMPVEARPGGWSPIKDVSDPHVREIAEYAVAEYNKEAKTALVFGRVIQGDTQVVAGMNYRLVIETKDGGLYEAVVYEKAWENFRNLTSFKPVTVKPGGLSPIKNLSDPHVRKIAEYAVAEYNKEAKTPLVFSRVIQGETQVVAGTNYYLIIETKDGSLYRAVVYEKAGKAMPGGWSPIKDLSDPHVREIAEYAVAEHNKEAKTALVFGRVIRGDTQLVAGMNYRLIIETKDGRHYQAVVYEKTWENFRNLTSFKPLLGGWSPIKDLSDPHVREIAEYAVAEHNKEANTALVFVRVIHGETQVVAGINYRLVIETKDGRHYVAVVWEKTWENFRKLTSFKPVKAL